MEPDWFLHHPKFLQIQTHGFGNPSQAQAAFQTYLDLAEVKLWQNVSIHPCMEMKLVYLAAQEAMDVSHRHILPLPADSALSMERFDQYFKGIDESEKDRVTASEQHQPITRLTLALVDNDSTIVYYHIHRGMHPPPPAIAS